MENTLIKNCINQNTQCKDCFYKCCCLLSNTITIKPYHGEWINTKQFDYNTSCTNELKNAEPKIKL